MYFDKKELKFKPIIVENGGVQEEEENGMDKNISSPYYDEGLLGTAEYASPEMINNNVINSLSTDIWALGCIIYNFFHGKTPFKGCSESVIFENIKNLRYTISTDVPEDVKDLISKILITAPEKRLGAGIKGSDLDFQALKNHEFFRGIDFINLNSQTPPFKVSNLLFKSFKSNDDLRTLFFDSASFLSRNIPGLSNKTAFVSTSKESSKSKV